MGPAGRTPNQKTINKSINVDTTALCTDNSPGQYINIIRCMVRPGQNCSQVYWLGTRPRRLPLSWTCCCSPPAPRRTSTSAWCFSTWPTPTAGPGRRGRHRTGYTHPGNQKQVNRPFDLSDNSRQFSAYRVHVCYFSFHWLPENGPIRTIIFILTLHCKAGKASLDIRTDIFLLARLT